MSQSMPLIYGTSLIATNNTTKICHKLKYNKFVTRSQCVCEIINMYD